MAQAVPVAAGALRFLWVRRNPVESGESISSIPQPNEQDFFVEPSGASRCSIEHSFDQEAPAEVQRDGHADDAFAGVKEKHAPVVYV